LEVLPNGGDGGMTYQVQGLVAGLNERGLDVLLATGSKTGRGGTAPESVFSFPELNLRSRNAMRAAWALRSIVRTERPDVVHGHGLRMAPVLTLATATIRPAPLVVTCHGIPPEQVPRAARYLKLSRAAIASCDDGPRALLAAEGIDSFLLRYGVSPPPLPSDRVELMRSLGLSEMLALVVSPGRLVPQKDHLTAIRTIQHLPGAALVIVGEGPLRAELQTEAEVLGVAGRVRLVGWRSDVRSIMGAADAVLLPSRWEGFGLVAIEAMTASVPVVAASSPGFREWLVHEDNALLAPIADHQQLAIALERVFGDADLRGRLIQGGKRTGDRYTVAAMLDTHLELYEELASRSRR
jgi:glycosyltransferase involved in cell wall biosynthesis